ncbi:MAG: glycine cleavage system protein GcvH [Candidatus Melainabacteria bacterium]|nr:glycine cleavage system protein GcvH [Candidatus Melainabacteria bacterium]
MDNYTIPAEVRLTETHEYIRVEDGRALIGISHVAAERLGDIVYVDLPENGQTIEKGETFGSVESVKAASDLYMPVSGEIISINTQLADEPDLINQDCYGDGWMIEVEMSNPDELNSLLTAKSYMDFVENAAENS